MGLEHKVKTAGAKAKVQPPVLPWTQCLERQEGPECLCLNDRAAVGKDRLNGGADPDPRRRGIERRRQLHDVCVQTDFAPKVRQGRCIGRTLVLGQ